MTHCRNKRALGPVRDLCKIQVHGVDAKSAAWEEAVQQGSLHYTPEHCLVNDGFPFFWVEKAMFRMGKMYLLRSPVGEKAPGLFHLAKSEPRFAMGNLRNAGLSTWLTLEGKQTKIHFST